MTTTLDRIAALKKGNLPARLRKGAEILGQLWREGLRCKDGWRQACSCAPSQTRFCEAKMKWLDLLKELHDGWPPYGLPWDEEFFMIKAMIAGQMFEASGLIVIVEMPTLTGVERIRVKSWKTIIDLQSIEFGPESDAAIAAVQKIGLSF